MSHTNEFEQPVGRPVEGWQQRPRPSRAPIVGQHVRLEPLDPERHAEQLHAAYMQAPDGRDWTYMAIDRLEDPAAYREFLQGAAASDDPLHYAIVDQRTGSAVGTGALMRIDRAQGAVEVGWLAFSRPMQRTPMSTETVYLMARHAFDELGYRRVEWKCDDLNARSKVTAARLGFTYEGTFRNAMVYKGRNRDTAWYSMTVEEWPRIRAGLEAWLAAGNFDDEGRQRLSLAECRAAIGPSDA